MNFSSEPLYAFVPPGKYGHNTEALATALGVTRKTVNQWRFRGLCTLHADQVAIRLGLHPVAIWPDWFASIADEPMCKWCGQGTLVNSYCSPECVALAAVERKKNARGVDRWWVRIDHYREFLTLQSASFLEDEQAA